MQSSPGCGVRGDGQAPGKSGWKWFTSEKIQAQLTNGTAHRGKSDLLDQRHREIPLIRERAAPWAEPLPWLAGRMPLRSAWLPPQSPRHSFPAQGTGRAKAHLRGRCSEPATSRVRYFPQPSTVSSAASGIHVCNTGGDADLQVPPQTRSDGLSPAVNSAAGSERDSSSDSFI